MLKRLAPLALSLLLAGPAAAFDLGAMSAAEREAFRAEVRAYLLDNPEVLMEAIAVLEQRQAEVSATNDKAMVRANAKALFDDGYSWVGGNPEGDITLVEFLDYKCTYCRRAYDEVMQLLETDGNIRFIVKEFPILGEQSLLASQYAIAVLQTHGDDSYEMVHDALMTLRSDVTVDVLAQLSASFGLDFAAIADKMQSKEIADIINQNALLAQRLQITGTPTFILEEEMLRGYVPLEQMLQFVEAVREGS